MVPKMNPVKPPASIFGGLPSLPTGTSAASLQGLLTGMPQVAAAPPQRSRKRTAGGLGVGYEVYGPEGESVGIFKDYSKALLAAGNAGAIEPFDVDFDDPDLVDGDMWSDDLL